MHRRSGGTESGGGAPAVVLGEGLDGPFQALVQLLGAEVSGVDQGAHRLGVSLDIRR